MPVKAKEPAKRGSRRTHRTSVRAKDAALHNKPSVGHEERLSAYQLRALQLKRKDYTHQEIGHMIAEEMNLERVPPITTVASWLKAGSDEVDHDIKELQWQMRLEQFNELEKLKRKWMPLATAQSLEITRWVRVEGEMQPELDENAVREQIEATKQVVAIMARQAKLLGLDIEKSIATNGEGPGSLQELQVWLINQVNISTGAPKGKSIEEGRTIDADILELKAGIPELDDNAV